MPPRPASFSLNPAWGQYVVSAAFMCALAIGCFRYLILDRVDSLHCQALLSEGRWLDDKYSNWQPEGCMMHSYQPQDVSACLESRRLVFLGDSVTRQLYFQMAHSLDGTLPTAPPEDSQKHTDHHLTTVHGVELLFYWDPYLNSSWAQTFVRTPFPSGLQPGSHQDRPALLVLGSGLWYLRYAESGGLPAWESMIESTLQSLSSADTQPADIVVILPIEDVVPAKLSPDRASTMHASDIDAMNSDLAHRIRPPSLADPFTFFGFFDQQNSLPVAFPSVFNHMLDDSQTEDGLHFSNAVVNMQASMLMNLRCNDALPKVFPLDKTCCTSYPWPSAIHLLVLAVTILWGPVSWILARRHGSNTSQNSFIHKEQMPAMIISISVALIYMADRTGFWLKEQKQFNPWTFSFLCIFSLAIGLLTVQRAENDKGFLNRDQTDEWKGWMQIAILIYHYTGASKVSGIYNPIRVLVASYLFMTGYGHATFYIKKADFGFLRVAQILIRLNLFTLVLAYTMNTDYISYYFSPLVSWWYLVIYVTMFIGARYNDRTPFLICKILLSLTLVTFVMRETGDSVLNLVFGFLERACGIHWSAREWSFRVNLDLWIVYVGMFAALAVIKIREYRLTEHPQWPLAVKAAAVVSALVFLWFFAFELSMDKFQYNFYHPFTSSLPVLAFAVLRNANPVLRSASSKAFAFIGKCSLETFIIQYHFWLAGDTKGLLLVIPGTRWRPVNMMLTTIMFIYVSNCVSQATGELTKRICGSVPTPALPTVMEVSNPRIPPATGNDSESGQEIIFQAPPDELELPVRKDNAGNVLPSEPDTPARPQARWVDRLAQGSSRSSTPGVNIWHGKVEWQPGLKAKLLIALFGMWILNILWTYPATT